MQQTFTKPYYIFFLVLPQGISQGFTTVTLPYILTHHGFSVAATASIVAAGVLANVFRFLWGPVVDISLSLRKWYGIGLIASTATILLICFTPLTVKATVLISIIVFISQVAGTFTLLPVNGFMAKRIEENKKGQASGWYQAGALAGVGLGGGAGLWLAQHYNIIISGVVLCVASFVFALVIFLIKDIQHNKQKAILHEITAMGKDIFTLLKIPIAIFAIILILLPIGTGAAANLWSAIADDWKVSADIVALITGALSGVVSAVGCIIGGWVADKKTVWYAYFFSGFVCAFITLIMAVMSYQPIVYIVGVLAYTFGIGLAYATFTSVVLFVIGKKNVATKFSLLCSLGNVPVMYMTYFDGWAHDKYNSKYMLLIEAFVGTLFIIISIIALKKMRMKNLVPVAIE